MTLLELVDFCVDVILVASIVASFVLFIDLLRRVRTMPTDILVARLYPASHRGFTPWHLIGAGMTFLMVSFLLHGLTGLFAPDLLAQTVHDVVREILAVTGFVLQATGLLWFDRIVRTTWSPLVKGARMAEP